MWIEWKCAPSPALDFFFGFHSGEMDIPYVVRIVFEVWSKTEKKKEKNALCFFFNDNDYRNVRTCISTWKQVYSGLSYNRFWSGRHLSAAWRQSNAHEKICKCFSIWSLPLLFSPWLERQFSAVLVIYLNVASGRIAGDHTFWGLSRANWGHAFLSRLNKWKIK